MSKEGEWWAEVGEQLTCRLRWSLHCLRICLRTTEEKQIKLRMLGESTLRFCVRCDLCYGFGVLSVTYPNIRSNKCKCSNCVRFARTSVIKFLFPAKYLEIWRDNVIIPVNYSVEWIVISTDCNFRLPTCLSRIRRATTHWCSCSETRFPTWSYSARRRARRLKMAGSRSSDPFSICKETSYEVVTIVYLPKARHSWRVNEEIACK